MFNDDGELTRENGTPHKGRAFYACALRTILKQKYFGSSAINAYIQLALVHDNIGETMKYLGRYDESLFINPISINVPTNIKVLGKMEINPTVTILDNKLEKTFNLGQFIENLNVDNQLKIAKFLNDGMGETQAVLALVKCLSTGNTVEKKASNTELIQQIVEGIMDYNHYILNTDDDIKNVVVPGCSVINKICELLHNKQFPPRTMRDYLDSAVDLNKELESMGIVNGLNNTSHNGKYHRKTSDELVDTIVEYI